MTAAHTPGPWALTRYGSSAYEIQGGGGQLAVVGLADDRRRAHAYERRNNQHADAYQRELALAEIQAINARDTERWANARLMHAALEMQELLQGFVAEWGDAIDVDDWSDINGSDAIEAIGGLVEGARPLLERIAGKEAARVE